MAAMPLPPDRADVLTETRNPRSMDLHRLPVAELVARIQDEDRGIHDALAAARPALVALLADAEAGFVAGGRLVYLGAGSSGRLGVLDASEAPPTFQVASNRVIGLIAGGDPALRRSAEGAEDDPYGAVPELERLELEARDTVIGIAAGGSTPWVRGGLEWCAARAAAPLTALLSCAPCRAPEGVCHLIVVETGPELLTGSTRMKAGTATKLVLNTLSTALMVRAGRVFENLMVDLRASNAKLLDRAARIVSTLSGVDRAAAFALLDAAGGVVKVAVLMQRLGLPRAEAEALLARHDGRLDRVLEQRR